MNKKRLFIANDASFLDTGYGVYGKELLTRLHNSDKFEVAELGCYAHHGQDKIKNIPWKFYPNAVLQNDPRIDQYKSNVINQFGAWRFNRAILDFKPHIVFDVRDYWMYAYQEMTPLKKYFSWVIMPTTDSAPQKIEWLYTFANADLVVPYTDWAKKVLEESCGHTINLYPKIANAGINPYEFFPIENKKEHKTKYLGGDYSVTGLVMRNQKRKLIADILIAYKKYLENLKQSNQVELYSKSILYIHTSFPEENGWDLPALLLEYGMIDKTYFTYVCKNCNKFFPGKFQGANTACKHCGNRSAIFSSAMHGIDTAQLNEVYNLFDIFIQYAICEGFGMPQVEAASCGLQLASVDYSAMTEIVEKLNGIKIPVQRLFRELETNADRAYPDNDATANILYNFFVNVDEDTKKNNSKIIRQKCIDIYSWDNVYKVWEDCFDSIDISKKIPWNSSIISETNHKYEIPGNLDPKRFIEHICHHVLNEPDLLKTANIQCLIRDFCAGLSSGQGTIRSLTYQQIVEILEQHLGNKINLEKMRANPQFLPKEDFI